MRAYEVPDLQAIVRSLVLPEGNTMRVLRCLRLGFFAVEITNTRASRMRSRTVDLRGIYTDRELVRRALQAAIHDATLHALSCDDCYQRPYGHLCGHVT